MKEKELVFTTEELNSIKLEFINNIIQKCEDFGFVKNLVVKDEYETIDKTTTITITL